MPSIATLVDLFAVSARRYASRPMLRSKRDGVWSSQTFAQWQQTSRTWALGLLALGLKPGERVVILAGTSADWVIADIAIALAGGVSVPVYPSVPSNEAVHIARDSGARFAFCSNETAVQRFAARRDELPDLQRVVCLDGAIQSEKIADWAGWVVAPAWLVEAAEGIDPLRLSTIAAEVDAQDPCTFVYTSGTTGPPKGVMLSHAAVVFEVRALVEILDLRDGDTLLLLLPLAHIFERIVGLVGMFRGIELIFASSAGAVIDDLQQTRPSILPGVPRVFEMVRGAAVARARQAGPIAERTFEWAISIGKQVAAVRRKGKPLGVALTLRHLLASQLVLDRLKDALGGNVRYCICGGAPLDPELARFFAAFDLPILEGYGLTETTAAATVNRAADNRLDSVGPAIPGTEITIAADGEVLIKGPHLMLGYHNQPEGTAAAIDEQGFFHTGDLGEMSSDGFLRITGRKKELIVTASGKNVAPQNVERHISNHPAVSQVMVYGDRRDFLSALITLDAQHIKSWAAANHVPFVDYREMSQRPEVYKMVQRVIDEKNRGLASYETIKKFAVLERELSEEAGELTPTLKLRRTVIAEKYAQLLDSFYSDSY